MALREVFRSLPVVKEIVREDALPPGMQDWARHTMTLGWEARLKTRARLRSDEGLEFGIALRLGVMLRDGDCLAVSSAQTVVRVVEEPESVLVIVPTDAEEWARIGYQLGNLHQPIMIGPGEIVCLNTLGLAETLAQLGIAFTDAERPFTPLAPMMDHAHDWPS